MRELKPCTIGRTQIRYAALANRRGADRFLSAEAAQADRYQRPLTIILIDIDEFKSINDDYGHEVGDAVIREFAAILSKTVREVDLAARWGGDEFLVATPGVDLRSARHAAQRCRRAIERAPIAGCLRDCHRRYCRVPAWTGHRGCHQPGRRHAIPRQGRWPKPGDYGGLRTGLNATRASLPFLDDLMSYWIYHP